MPLAGFRVNQVSLASSLAVYSGLADGPFDEERSLPVASPSATSAMKKAEEVLALHHADRSGLDLRVLRIGITYGPLYHTLANQVSRLTHLAVRGTLEPHRLADRAQGGLFVEVGPEALGPEIGQGAALVCSI